MLLTRFLVLGAAALALAVPSSPAPTVVPVAAPLETLQIGTNGRPQGTLITWVCNSPSGFCVDKAGPSGRWTTTITVARGTQVWIAVENLDRSPVDLPDCWIARTDTGEMLSQTRSHCQYQGPRMPFDPAPPSDT